MFVSEARALHRLKQVFDTDIILGTCVFGGLSRRSDVRSFDEVAE